VKKARQF